MVVRMRTSRFFLAVMSAVVAWAVAVPAHAGAWASRSQTMNITAIDDQYRIHTDGQLRAGLVRIRFDNDGTGDHEAQLFLLHDRVSFAEFKADLLAGNPAAFTTDAVPRGGAAVMSAGHDQVFFEALQGGTYAMACFVRDKNGVPHFAMGMLTSFTVAGHLSAAQLAGLTPARRTDGQISAHDMTFTMPAVLRAGRLYQFRDTDLVDDHQVNVGRLPPGKTVAEALAWFRSPAGPPPFVSSGGLGADSPGGLGGWFILDARPGNYVAFCLVVDPSTGRSHAAMGMVVGFRVLAAGADSRGQRDHRSRDASAQFRRVWSP